MNTPSQEGGMERRERNDCTVATLAHAAGIPYEVAYEIAKSAGRRAGGRVSGSRVVEVAKRHGLRLFKVRMASRTLRKFLTFKPTGRYIASLSGHWLSVVDGVPGDKTPLGSIIRDAWEVR